MALLVKQTLHKHQLIQDKFEVKRIDILCTLLGVTQSEVARELGISKQRLNHIIKGNTKIDERTATGIAVYFGVPINIFLNPVVHMVLSGNKLEIL